MSYDLYLKPRSGEISKERFLAFFQGRSHYKLQGQQAWYQNEDTGVYFSFEMQSIQAEAEDDDFSVGYPVLFNMNFFRPSFFVLEAETELSSVVRELDFVVLDPQTDGLGEGEFDPSIFVSCWKKGNEAGYSAILQDPENRPDIATMPAEKLERIWRWNHGRGNLQQSLGESVFVPRISFFKEDGAVISSVVWSVGIPTAFPSELDAVVVYLKDLAPRTLFGRKEMFSTVGWSLVRPLIRRFAHSHENALIGAYSTPPKDVLEFLRSLPPRKLKLARINADTVHDAELVAKYS